MDPDQQEAPAVRERTLPPGQLTVMIVRSVGKIRSFKISRRAVFLTAMFFLVYIVASLFLINGFINLRREYKLLTKNLVQLEDDLNVDNKNLLQSRQHVSMLEDYIRDIQERQERERTQVKKPQPESTVQKETVVNIERDEEIIPREDPSPKVVNIEEFVIRKENSWMTVDFRLVNTRPEDNAMEGYIHIFAADKGNSFPADWSYPKDKVKDGIPLNYRYGQPFFIQRFKPYHRQFNRNSNSELPSDIRVLVYDRAGTLLLEKKFEVNNVP